MCYNVESFKIEVSGDRSRNCLGGHCSGSFLQFEKSGPISVGTPEYVHSNQAFCSVLYLIDPICTSITGSTPSPEALLVLASAQPHVRLCHTVYEIHSVIPFLAQHKRFGEMIMPVMAFVAAFPSCVSSGEQH